MLLRDLLLNDVLQLVEQVLMDFLLINELLHIEHIRVNQIELVQGPFQNRDQIGLGDSNFHLLEFARLRSVESARVRREAGGPVLIRLGKLLLSHVIHRVTISYTKSLHLDLVHLIDFCVSQGGICRAARPDSIFELLFLFIICRIRVAALQRVD